MGQTIAEMKPGKRTRRVVRIYGVDRPVVVTITTEGLSMKVLNSGQQQVLYAPWRVVAEKLPTPPNAKCFLAGQPIEFLNYQSKKAVRLQIKREEQKNGKP